MELYACGLNAHGQLFADSDGSCLNIHNFRKVADGQCLRILSTFWSATILELDGNLIVRGYHLSACTADTDYTITCPESKKGHGIRSIIGKQSGVIGAIADDGKLLEFVRTDQRAVDFAFRRRESAWVHQKGHVLDHVSIAGNDSVAVVSREFNLLTCRCTSKQLCFTGALSCCPWKILSLVLEWLRTWTCIRFSLRQTSLIHTEQF